MGAVELYQVDFYAKTNTLKLQTAAAGRTTALRAASVLRTKRKSAIGLRAGGSSPWRAGRGPNAIVLWMIGILHNFISVYTYYTTRIPVILVYEVNTSRIYINSQEVEERRPAPTLSAL